MHLIRTLCGAPEADVHFLVGGTQVNLVSCAAFLRPFEAVIAPCTGHPLVHETGALQATGHMVISVPSDDGKLTPDKVRAVCSRPFRANTWCTPAWSTFPIPPRSAPLTARKNLSAPRMRCAAHWSLYYIYLDGARLGNGMVSSDCAPLTWTDLTETLDAFTIGGTKNGILFGEALVITNDALESQISVPT